MYSYARSHNPTWTALEKAISQIESGVFAPGTEGEGGSYRAASLVVASGRAACTAVFGAVLRPGDIAVLPDNAYFHTRTVMRDYFGEMGVQVRYAGTAKDAQGEHLEGAKLLWIETQATRRWRSATLSRCAEKRMQRARWSPWTIRRLQRLANVRLRWARIFRLHRTPSP